jgi:hypothetical protein
MPLYMVYAREEHDAEHREWVVEMTEQGAADLVDRIEKINEALKGVFDDYGVTLIPKPEDKIDLENYLSSIEEMAS